MGLTKELIMSYQENYETPYESGQVEQMADRLQIDAEFERYHESESNVD